MINVLFVSQTKYIYKYKVDDFGFKNEIVLHSYYSIYRKNKIYRRGSYLQENVVVDILYTIMNDYKFRDRRLTQNWHNKLLKDLRVSNMEFLQ